MLQLIQTSLLLFYQQQRVHSYAVSGVTTTLSGSNAFVELTTSALTNAANPNAGFNCSWESANAVNAEDGSAKVVTLQLSLKQVQLAG